MPPSAKPKASSGTHISAGKLFSIVFALAYLVAFLRVELPNQPQGDGDPLRRLELLSLLTVPEAVSEAVGPLSNFTGVLPRLYSLTLAAGYLCLAAAFGFVLLRVLHPQVTHTRAEQWSFALGLGLAGLSLLTLLLGVFGLLLRWLFLAIGAVILGVFVVQRPVRQPYEKDAGLPDDASPSISRAWLWILTPLVLMLLCKSTSPPIDFDVREYHLQAPKEFFQNGRIGFLPHNIYGNMPLGAEMHALAAMVFTQNWFAGAIIGKVVIASFALIGALAIYAFGCRYLTQSAAVVGAIAYLTTPWVLLESSEGLIDCVVGAYTLLALYALALWRDALAAKEPVLATSRLILCGLLTGAAVSCKYPALLFVTVPVAGYVFASNVLPRTHRSRLAALGILVAATAVVSGPWFAKNWILAGNPTYPLLYSVFGGETRTPEKDAQWRRAHAPPNYKPSDFFERLKKASLKSDWLGVATIPLAIIAVVGAAVKRRSRETPASLRLIFQLSGYCLLVFVLWWLLTHRIDRFLLPLLPVVAVLAGGAMLFDSSPWQNRLVLTYLILAIVYAVAVCIFAFGMVGHHADGPSSEARGWFVDPRYAALRPAVAHLQEAPALPSGNRILLVGDACAFDYRVPVLYNTCFDDCILEQLIAGKKPEEAKAAFHAARIGYVYVDWNELRRYRSPGNYGYSPFPTRRLFDDLVKQNVLDPLANEESASIYRVVD